jgi:hypothetical protein
MSQDCKHFNVIGHEHGAWCQECGKQVGGSMLREPVMIPSPLVIAADQLAKTVEKLAAIKRERVCIHDGESWYCDCCQYNWEMEIDTAKEDLRTALANYKRVREG